MGKVIGASDAGQSEHRLDDSKRQPVHVQSCQEHLSWAHQTLTWERHVKLAGFLPKSDLAGCIVWQWQVEELVEEALEAGLILDNTCLRLAAGPNDNDPVSRLQSCYLQMSCRNSTPEDKL